MNKKLINAFFLFSFVCTSYAAATPNVSNPNDPNINTTTNAPPSQREIELRTKANKIRSANTRATPDPIDKSGVGKRPYNTPNGPVSTTPITRPNTNPIEAPNMSDTQTSNNDITLKNCAKQDIKNQDGNFVLHTGDHKKPQLYLIRNTSKYIITVDHTKDNPGASAGWASRMHPGNWSAMIISEPNFMIKCSRGLLRGGAKNISCQDLVSVCYYDNFTDKENIASMGTFWLVEDLPYTGFQQKMETRQISFPYK
jgi:hypothetical protein